MSAKINPLTLLTAVCLAGASLYGAISSMNQLKIDFTNPEDSAAKAVWSDPDKLTLTEKGLGWDGEAASVRDGWIQTKAFAVGLSWRPTSSVGIRVTIEPSPKPIVL